MSEEDKVKLLRQIWEAERIDWFTSDIQSWKWYLALAITVFSIIMWWKLVDRKRIFEISFLGLLAGTLATTLDSIGVNSGLWTYPDKLIHISPELLLADHIVIPIVFMLVYQFTRTWKEYLTVWIIMALVATFIVDPILIKLSVYKLINWELIYSYPIWIILAVFVKLATELFVSITVASKGEEQHE